MSESNVVKGALLSALLVLLLLPLSSAAANGKFCNDGALCQLVGKIIQERPSPSEAVSLATKLANGQHLEVHQYGSQLSVSDVTGLPIAPSVLAYHIWFTYAHKRLVAVQFDVQHGCHLKWSTVRQVFGPFTWAQSPVDSYAINHQRHMPWGKYVVGTIPSMPSASTSRLTDPCVSFLTIEFSNHKVSVHG